MTEENKKASQPIQEGPEKKDGGTQDQPIVERPVPPKPFDSKVDELPKEELSNENLKEFLVVLFNQQKKIFNIIFGLKAYLENLPAQGGFRDKLKKKIDEQIKEYSGIQNQIEKAVSSL